MTRQLVARHVIAGLVGLVLTYGFWLTRPQWDPEMRLWKAVGDGSLIFLYATMAVGAVAKIWPSAGRAVRYRRELGIWFGILALLHTVLIVNGWARWDTMRFLGYDFVPELGRLVRIEPGFGLANLMGLVAVLISVALMVTSGDWAVRGLGGSAWKFLHYGAYIILWLAVLHTAYFLFLHYTEHFHRRPPPPDWFRWPFVLLTLGLLSVQTIAFVQTVRQHNTIRRSSRRRESREGLVVSEK
jgi:methionine sulfoxide reductase heme-binding subunit